MNGKYEAYLERKLFEEDYSDKGRRVPVTPRLSTDLKDRTWLVAESKHGRIIYIRIDEIQSIFFSSDGPCASIETPGSYFDLAHTPDQIWALLEKRRVGNEVPEELGK